MGGGQYAVMAPVACLFLLTGAWSLLQLALDFKSSSMW